MRRARLEDGLSPPHPCPPLALEPPQPGELGLCESRHTHSPVQGGGKGKGKACAVALEWLSSIDPESGQWVPPPVRSEGVKSGA